MASSKLARRRNGSVPKEGPGGFDPTHSLIPHGAGPIMAKNGYNNVNSSNGTKANKAIKDFKLDDLDMVKTIGTGTFARVYLCRPKANLNRYEQDCKCSSLPASYWTNFRL